jgi:hypothetical protein
MARTPLQRVSAPAVKSRHAAQPNPDLDERVRIPLDPETALRELLKVNPDAEPADDEQSKTPSTPAK